MEREQLDVAAMNERAYRRFVRQSLMQRLNLLRGVRGPRPHSTRDRTTSPVAASFSHRLCLQLCSSGSIMGGWMVGYCAHTFAPTHVPLTAVCKDHIPS